MDKILSGRVTVPTDVDMVEETKNIVAYWKADALRDCDGTEMPDELRQLPAKIYSTYYTTRKDNRWAEEHPDEIQQVYLMTRPYTARDTLLRIRLMQEFYDQQLKPNTLHDIKRWWEVIDRTTGEVVSVDEWFYDEVQGEVVIDGAEMFHDYTVSFLAFIIWDPVHMYNFITNSWEEVEHQKTYDVRLPQTQAYAIGKLRRWLEENPDTDVVRFTTFFHQFTLVFDEQAREKFVDWFGYSASVSPYILERFEQEAGYRFRPEYIIDQGYHNNTNRVPSREFKDFMRFQMREVASLMKVFVDICHEYGKEAMMFLGDHWIGTEPYGEYFKHAGLDAVVGSVGNGTTLRLISDIEGVRYTEGRFLPYFFPDVFNEDHDPVQEAKVNWVTARRAILRKPVDRIGYGGYLKLALQFPDFVDYIRDICDEFRMLYENIGREKPYSHFKVGILNCWGKVRSWGMHMVAHAIDYKQTYSYAGVLEALSGMPFDVAFISFDDVRQNPGVLSQCQVVINMGDAMTGSSGGVQWDDPLIVTAVKAYVDGGGGFIGVGEPSAYQKQGSYFTLATMMGVDKEVGFSLSTDKYNWEVCSHFITEAHDGPIDFGEGMRNIYAHPGTQILSKDGEDVQMAVSEFGQGRCVYISGLPYSFENSRLLYRAIFWAAGKENEIEKWYSTNCRVEVNYYTSTGKYCIVNNTYEPQTTVVYDQLGRGEKITLAANEILWKDIDCEAGEDK